MCLIALAWHAHPEYELIVAANRDEFHARPAQDAGWWLDHPDVLAGRDLLAGGSWFAVTRSGRFATVTNYREQSFTRSDLKSRGALVTNFVVGGQSPSRYSRGLDDADYAGFSLLTADRDTVSYVSNRGDSQTDLGAGIYGLSNAALDTPWAKVNRSKKRLRELIDEDAVSADALFEILSDRETADEDANSEHLSPKQARAITAPFIVADEYGTRCSTVLLRRHSGKTEFREQRFNSIGEPEGISRFSF